MPSITIRWQNGSNEPQNVDVYSILKNINYEIK